LPDSNVNEPASHGFFNFKIEHKAGIPLPTIIENTAAIYFDFNPPIVTNNTLHTIDTGFIAIKILGTENILIPEVTINVFPNPFQTQATVQIDSETDYKEIRLEVFDLLGRSVKIINSNQPQLTIGRQELSAGQYIYRLSADGVLLNIGKLLVQ